MRRPLTLKGKVGGGAVVVVEEEVVEFLGSVVAVAPFNSLAFTVVSLRSKSMMTGRPPADSSGTWRVVPAGGCNRRASLTAAVV